MQKNRLLVLFLLFFGLPANAGLLFTYNQLALRDLDQMAGIIRQKINESRRVKGDKTVPLKEALQAVFARPNEDFMIEKILQPLRNELEEYDAYEKAFSDLVKEASSALKNERAFSGKVLATYWIFLENVVAELKPKAAEKFEKSILTQIRDAKIEIPKKARDERKLSVMKVTNSPSGFAKEILEAAEKPPAK